MLQVPNLLNIIFTIFFSAILLVNNHNCILWKMGYFSIADKHIHIVGCREYLVDDTHSFKTYYKNIICYNCYKVHYILDCVFIHICAWCG